MYSQPVQSCAVLRRDGNSASVLVQELAEEHLKHLARRPKKQFVSLHFLSSEPIISTSLKQLALTINKFLVRVPSFGRLYKMTKLICRAYLW